MFPSVPQPAHRSLNGESRPSTPILATIWNILYIFASLILGGILLWLPWQGVWEHNYLVYRYPRIQPLVTDPFFKGAILGLGINNILLGIRQIVQIKNATKGPFLR